MCLLWVATHCCCCSPPRCLPVPFIVRGPGVRKNATVDAIGLNVDVAVTIADLVGITIPVAAQVDGRSLKPLLTTMDRAPVRHEFVFEHSGGNISPAGVPNGTCGTAWMQPGGKPINGVPLCRCGNPMNHWLNSANNTYQGLRILNASHNFKYISYADQVGFEELFDLSTDPHELDNIVSAGGSVLGYMRARLEELRKCGRGGEGALLCP